MFRPLNKQIREQKKFSEVIKASEEKFMTIAEQIPDALFVQDLEDPEVPVKIIEVNEAACKMHGYAREELIGKSIAFLDDPKTAEMIPERTVTLLAGETLIFEGSHIRKDGTTFPVEVSARQIKFRGRKLSLAIDRDITERKRFEKVIKDSEQKYRRLIESANDAIFIADAETGILIDANTKAEELVGMTKEKIIGMHQTQLHPKEEADNYENIFQVAVQTGRVTVGDIFVVHKDGHKVPVEISASILEMGGKKIIQGIFRDIKERKMAEEELNQLNRELLALHRISEISLKTQKLRNIYQEIVNEISLSTGFPIVALEHYDKGRQMMIFEGAKGIPFSGNSGILEVPVEQTLSGIVARTGEVMVEAEAGERREYSNETLRKLGVQTFVCIPMKVRDSVIGTLSLAHPEKIEIAKSWIRWLESLGNYVASVTDRKQAEVDLLESEERFRQLFAQTDDAVVLLEPETHDLIDANHAAIDLFGYTKEELFEQSRSLFKWLYESNEGIQSNTVYDKFPIVYRDFDAKDGTTKTLACRYQTINLRRQDVLYCSFRDITEKLRMEEEAKNIETKLVQANKMTALGTLVSEIAHEVNNPNNFIMFNTPILLDVWQDAMPVLEEYYREHGEFSVGGLPFTEMRLAVPRLLSGISDGSSRIKHIIDNLRNFARHDRAGVEGKVDINQCIQSAVSILDNQIKNSTYIFNIELKDDLPAVRGNAQKLTQVIINLIMNALQALPDNHRGIWVTNSFDMDSGDVVIKVRDEGVGMNKETLEHMKEPFYSTKHGESMGLGLSICHSIIEKHRGSLEFESGSGKGTTAIIRLPIR
jgi:PAS domain S-box-containing protein